MANALDTILIETFGNAKYMQSFLDGIVIMMDTHNTGSSAPSLFMTVTYVAMVLTISIGLLKIQRTDWWNYMLRLVIPCLLFVVLIKAEINTVILDDVYDDSLYGGTGTYSVNNVPVGIALPLYVTSLIEKTGLSIADHLDVFIGGFSSGGGGSTVNVSGQSFDIRQVDFFGPARAFATVIDPTSVAISSNYYLVRSLEEYFNNCILHAMSMNLIDPGKIMTSPDVFTEIATPFLAFFTNVYEDDGSSQLQTCFAAYNYIDTQLNGAAGVGGGVFEKAGAEVMVNALKAEEMVNDLIGLAYVGGGAVSQANQLIKNNIVIAGIQGALTSGTPEAVAALSVGEAQSSQGMKASALLFIKKLPLMRSVLQMVLICLFPLIAWSFVTQLGKPFLAWCSGLVWVSLFMPLEGIIHTVYMGTLVDELSAVISTNGVTWENRQLVMNTLSQGAVVASGLFMMIFALSGMVTTWILPKAAGSISNMLSGASRIGMQMGSYGANAAEGIYSGKIGASMQRENFNQAVSGMSPSYNNLADAWGDFYKSRSNQLNGIYGDGSIMQRNYGAASDQTTGKMVLTEGQQAQRMQAFAEQKQAMATQANNITDMASKGASFSGVQSFSDAQNYVKGLGSATQQAIRSSEQFQKARSAIDGWATAENWSNSQKDDVATSVALGAAFGLKSGGLGGGLDGRTQSGSSDSNSFLDSLSHGQREQLAHMASSNRETANSTTSDASQKTSDSIGVTSNQSASDIESQIRNASESFSKTFGHMQSYGETVSRAESNGLNTSIDVGQLITRTDTGVLSQMATDNPSQYKNLNAAMVNGETSPQALATAATADYKAADSQGRQAMANDILSRYSQEGISDRAYVAQMEDVAGFNAAGAYQERASQIMNQVNAGNFDEINQNANAAAGTHDAMADSMQSRGSAFQAGHAGASGQIAGHESGFSVPPGAGNKDLATEVQSQFGKIDKTSPHDAAVKTTTTPTRGFNDGAIATGQFAGNTISGSAQVVGNAIDQVGQYASGAMDKVSETFNKMEDYFRK